MALTTPVGGDTGNWNVSEKKRDFGVFGSPQFLALNVPKQTPLCGTEALVLPMPLLGLWFLCSGVLLPAPGRLAGGKHEICLIQREPGHTGPTGSVADWYYRRPTSCFCSGDSLHTNWSLQKTDCLHCIR